MERFKPQIEAFLASLPKGAVAQLISFKPAGADKQVIALVMSDDALTTQAGINTIDQGVRSQKEQQGQRMRSSFVSSLASTTAD